MTGFDKRVKRVTLGSYRITVTGAIECSTGKRLVVMLHCGDNGNGDYISIREAGRRYTVTLSVPELYRRGLIAQTKQDMKGRGKQA